MKLPIRCTLSLCVFVAAIATVQSASGAEIALSTSEAKCILKNKSKYLETPRALIQIVPDACPLTAGDAVAFLARNSRSDSLTEQRVYWISRVQMQCLINKIQKSLSQQATATPNDIHHAPTTRPSAVKAGPLSYYPLECPQ